MRAAAAEVFQVDADDAQIEWGFRSIFSDEQMEVDEEVDEEQENSEWRYWRE